MTKYWAAVAIAALFETGWVIGLKHADDFWSWAATAICIVGSFYVVVIAGNRLPAGSVYAVFVGLGTAGTVLSEMVLFHAPVEWGKLALIVVLLTGVLGLKMSTEGHEKKG